MLEAQAVGPFSSIANARRSDVLLASTLICYLLIAADIVPGITGLQADYEPGYLDVMNIDKSGDIIRQALLAPFFFGAVYLLVRTRRREHLQQLGWPAALVILICLFSALWSSDPGATLRKVLGLVGTFAVGTYVATRLSLFRLIKLAQIAVTIALVGSFLWLLIAPDKALDTNAHLRGLFNHKNILGQFAGIGYLAFLSLAVQKRVRRRMLWVGGAGLCVLSLLLASSATPLIAIGFVTGWAYARFRLGLRPRELVVLTGLICTGGILFLVAAPDVFTLVIGRDVTLSGRTNIWEFALEMAAAKPFLGYGYGVFWLGPNSPGSLFWDRTLQFELSAHNGYLQCLLDIGLVGFLTTLVAVLGPLLRSSKGHRPYVGGAEIFSEWFLIFFLILNVAEIRFFDPTSVVTFVFAFISANLRGRIRQLELRADNAIPLIT
ncbi:O-antigen ligase family protein [Bradyrhizobium commune]|uniref:O-antigen ligase family protein n=1 Tax=Bradyrhizobium commune TaxID=83627 RepID=A0A7S9D340_9BRAD|nr:O-antigen ligase family protein [Bradyrhizobium commune]QPF90261.1 O-antigen ligase family protein [Bradyrhizobium commune]